MIIVFFTNLYYICCMKMIYIVDINELDSWIYMAKRYLSIYLDSFVKIISGYSVLDELKIEDLINI